MRLNSSSAGRSIYTQVVNSPSFGSSLALNGHWFRLGDLVTSVSKFILFLWPSSCVVAICHKWRGRLTQRKKEICDRREETLGNDSLLLIKPRSSYLYGRPFTTEPSSEPLSTYSTGMMSALSIAGNMLGLDTAPLGLGA